MTRRDASRVPVSVYVGTECDRAEYEAISSWRDVVSSPHTWGNGVGFGAPFSMDTTRFPPRARAQRADYFVTFFTSRPRA